MPEEIRVPLDLSDAIALTGRQQQEIAELKGQLEERDYKIDLLRGELELCKQETFTVRQQIERLTALSNERQEIIAEQAQEIEKRDVQIAERDLSLEGSHVALDIYGREVEQKDKEITEWKGEAAAWKKSFNIEWERLSRLTALINDDERAEKVALTYDYHDNLIAANRRKGINDYRTMLREEREK